MTLADDIEQDIDRVVKKLDKQPASSLRMKEYRKHGNYSITEVRRTLGKWSYVMGRSKDSEPGNSIDKQELKDDIRRVAKKTDGNLTREDYQNDPDSFSVGSVNNHFGSWSNMKNELGLSGQAKQEDVIRELKSSSVEEVSELFDISEKSVKRHVRESDYKLFTDRLQITERDFEEDVDSDTLFKIENTEDGLLIKPVDEQSNGLNDRYTREEVIDRI